MESPTHTCFRCGTTLRSEQQAFCSERCKDLSAENLGPVVAPHPWLLYDYSTFDPEDCLYGEYEANPEMASREDYRLKAPREPNEDGNLDEEELDYETISALSLINNVADDEDDSEREGSAEEAGSDFELAVAFPERTAALSANARSSDRPTDDEPSTNASQGDAFDQLAALFDSSAERPEISDELRARLGEELRLVGPGAILAQGPMFAARVGKDPSVFPEDDRRHLLEHLDLTDEASAETRYTVRMLLEDSVLQDETFAACWNATLSDPMRAQLLLWAFQAGAPRARATQVLEAGLRALTIAGPSAQAGPELTPSVFSYLETIAPYAPLAPWATCALAWTERSHSQLGDPRSPLWRALDTWWITNHPRIDLAMLSYMASCDFAPKQVRDWAVRRELQAVQLQITQLQSWLSNHAS